MREEYDQLKGKLDYAPPVRSFRLRNSDAPENKQTQDKGIPKPNRKKMSRRRYLWLRLFNWKWFLLVLTTSSLLVAGFVMSLLAAAEFQRLDKVEKLKSQPAVSVQGGQKLYYEFVPIHQLRVKNKMLVDAFVKVEDVRFYQHQGVDYYALFRATIKTLLGRKQGGGTITMQVARNVVIGSHAQKLSRKLNEIAVAWNLDRKFSKDQVLEAYLNGIGFGNGIQGIQLAAKAYFGKDLRYDELTPEEVAILVAIINGPDVYDPYRSETTKKNLKMRRNAVLDVMAKEDDGMKPLISSVDRERWKQTDLSVRSEAFKNRVIRQVAGK
ncbi:biosynthetic peptidoglycan transglycosylase [Thermoflavimicrobium dichotomicum]|uniref:peptidoglycan glycosyltransferase n=1 Tax=Thermoflavimicrobium dichotomicum TaxID=46223 RepID=A0A1I3RM77_9BACL|nr:biosynthetic peptidoglycan transglycosylase [Thermoflavimicrobium dichotomicum]SFJ46276.1 penicillin-binding protein 1A [Thermoflavimicrobium dichotomicum]